MNFDECSYLFLLGKQLKWNPRVIEGLMVCPSAQWQSPKDMALIALPSVVSESIVIPDSKQNSAFFNLVIPEGV